MKINRICAVLLGTAISVSAFAQADRHFTRGFYAGVDASAGTVVNDRLTMQSRNLTYGFDMAAGYRFCPQLVVGAGFSHLRSRKRDGYGRKQNRSAERKQKDDQSGLDKKPSGYRPPPDQV